MMDPSHPAAQSGEFYRTLMINSPVAIAYLDMEGRVAACNPAFCRLFGYAEEEALGQHLDSLVADQELYQEAASYTRRILERGETIRTAGRRRRKDGAYVDTEMQGVPVKGGREVEGALVLYHDITDRLKAEKSLRESHGSLEMILDSLDADVYAADLDSYEILFMNRHMKEGFGGDFTGQICYRVFRGQEAPCAHCSNPRLLDSSGRPAGVYTWEGKNPITGRWYKNSDRVISWSDGRPVRLQIATDITDLKEAEARLEHMATHDPLTRLPNRFLFMDRLQHSLKMAKRKRRALAVLFVDIDGFKDVNDRLGHAAGDDLLQQFAERMCCAVRDSDTVARISGDEFAVILEELQVAETVDEIAARLLHATSSGYPVQSDTVPITTSIGIAVFPLDSGSPEGLLTAADQAMYRVKKMGKHGFVRFSRGEGAQ